MARRDPHASRLAARCHAGCAAVAIAVLASLAALTAPAPARACGPDFPHRLLLDRKATLLTLVEGSFDWEAAHLVDPPAPGFPVVDGEPDGARAQGGPRERALYDAGARAFHAGDLDTATAQWRALLALAPEERRHRSTWAAFMLGRATGAPRWFVETRALAAAGFDDALGLAAASLGEEARLALHDGDDAAAVRLYAEQAALGAEAGRTSLLFVARALVNDEARLASAARDPRVRALVAAYLYARSTELEGAWNGAHVAQLARLVRALERASLDGGDVHEAQRTRGLDRLAAAAYRAGQFDLARRLAARSDAPLATWVRAKLALRDGALDEARALLAEAAAAFPPDAGWSTSVHEDELALEHAAPRARLDGERAVLALDAREYAAALTQLVGAGSAPSARYWLDAAWVAERVLSLDELVAWVRVHAPGPVPPVPSEWGATPHVLTELRALLARRLVRAHRFDEALAYFDDPRVRARARSYGALVTRGLDVTAPRGARAQALYEASRIARVDGIDILAFEGDPDWAAFEGAFELDDAVPGAAFASYDEQLRAFASAAAPHARFHYRVLASDLAADAAELLPPRSQAYAAVLCAAASYVIDRHPERASTLWLRTVDHGALVDVGTFGRACHAPDFAGAARRWRDDGTLRPPPPPPRRVARDAALLCAVALATHVLARALTRRRRAPIAPQP